MDEAYILLSDSFRQQLIKKDNEIKEAHKLREIWENSARSLQEQVYTLTKENERLKQKLKETN